MTAATFRRGLLTAGAAVTFTLLVVVWLRPTGRETSPVPTPLDAAGTPSTTRAELARTIASQEARLVQKPNDPTSAVMLADALLRQARVTSNPGLAVRAESVLAAVLAGDPRSYDARRMLGAVYLSEHRFREAIAEAERCRQIRADDAWTYGVLGDAHIELGEYPQAFDAFDRMASLRPNAASYARASYAREVQGDLDGALRLMSMSAEATGPQDPESLAWHYAQLGHLYFELGRLADAKRQYEHAEYTFPGHPFAADGLARIAAAEGDYARSLALVRHQLEVAPTPADAAFAGDLLVVLGRPDEANREYALAETGWRVDAPEPKALARFLADHDRNIAEAVQVAERAATERQDIWTEDALAWSYFKAGRLMEAATASTRAMRTGSRDRELLYHAAAIAHAHGDDAAARGLVGRALAGQPRFDLVAAPAAAQLSGELRTVREVAER